MYNISMILKFVMKSELVIYKHWLTLPGWINMIS
jgi:hypothetical protein